MSPGSKVQSPSTPGPGPLTKLVQLPRQSLGLVVDRIRHWDPWFRNVVLAMAVYAFLYSVISSLKYLTFNTFAWDLGIYNQVMYSLVNGHGFHYTVEYFINPSGNYMAQHFAPDLLLIAPIYALYPSPITLLVIQSIVVALGAYPIWLIARARGFTPRSSAMLSWAYLLFTPVWGANWYDFHLETFLIAAMLFAVYFWMKHRWILFWASLCVALFTEESAAFFVIFFGITLVLTNLDALLRMFRRPVRFLVEGWMPLVVVVVGTIYFVGVRAVQHALNPVIPAPFLGVYEASSNWSILGISNPLDPLPLLGLFVHDPGRIWEALIFAFPAKFLYLAFFFVPLLLTPLRRIWWLIPGVPWFVAILLSNYPPYYTLGYQYSSFLIPWFFVATIRALEPGGLSWKAPQFLHLRWVPRRLRGSPQRIVLAIPTFFILVTLLLVAVPTASTAVGSGPGFQPSLVYPSMIPGERSSGIWTLIGLIPPSASVVTQENLFPAVSSREDAYVVPYVSPQSEAWALDASHIHGPIQFVLFDPASEPGSSIFLNDTFIAPGGYELRGQAGSAVLYEWDYHGTVSVISV